WVVFGVGRFTLGMVAHFVGEVGLVRYGAALATAGALLFGMGPVNMAWLGLAAIALGLAPVFPTLMSCTPARTGEAMASKAVALHVSCSAVGVASMPAVAGLLASGWGLHVIPGLLVLNGLILVLLHEVLVQKLRN